MFNKKFVFTGKLQYKNAKIDMSNFMEDNKNKFIFIIEYADENGSIEGTMEHGDIFRNVPHIRINNH